MLFGWIEYVAVWAPRAAVGVVLLYGFCAWAKAGFSFTKVIPEL